MSRVAHGGVYHVSKKIIYFCPFDLDELSMTIDELIMHEIRHVESEKYVKRMTHKEKEVYINNK